MSVYGRDRVRRGLQHFLIGKIVSAVAGFTAMVLVVRALPVPEFAAYSVLIALVEVFTALSGMGLSHIILRYVPELFNAGRMMSLRQVVSIALLLRSAVLVVALLIAWALAVPIARLVGLEDMVQAFQLFLLVVGLRSTSHFLSQILESTLHQGYSQLGFSAAAIGRCVGMFWLLQAGDATLMHVIVLEAVCDGLACVVLGIGVFNVLRSAPASAMASTVPDHWASTHRRQMARFALSAYLQHLATLPYGGNTNRLVGGVMFGDRVMASFGFALSLYEYAKRYLPTQLLIGVIRPVVVARFTADRNFPSVAKLCEQSFQINLMFLLGVAAGLAVAGPELLAIVSAGKYGRESAVLLIALLAVLVLETQRLVLEVLTQTVERYDLMIVSNLFLSSSVLLGILVYPWVGAIGFPVANGLALLLANVATIRRLSASGFRYTPDHASTFKVLGMSVAASLVGYLCKLAGAGWLTGLVACSMVYVLLAWKFQLSSSIAYTRDLLGRH